MKTKRFGAGTILVASWLWSCGGPSGSSYENVSCSVGAEACSCTPGGACDPGLVCLSSVCVNAGGGAGGSSGNGGGHAPDGGPDLEIEQSCVDLSETWCRKLSQCNVANFRLVFGDMNTCRARRTSICLAYGGLRASGDTPQARRECAQALANVTCTAWLGDFENSVAACLERPGQLGSGQVCASNQQCQTTQCRAPSGATCGVCGPASGPGEACTYSGDCVNGLPCINRICVKPGGLGAPCTTSEACNELLACKAGQCAEPAQPGETCTPDACDFYQELTCSSNKVCIKFRYAAPGESCDPGNGIVCERSGICRVPVSGSPGTCMAPAEDGQACSTSYGPPCLPYASCVDGSCRRRGPEICK